MPIGLLILFLCSGLAFGELASPIGDTASITAASGVSLNPSPYPTPESQEINTDSTEAAGIPLPGDIFPAPSDSVCTPQVHSDSLGFESPNTLQLVGSENCNAINQPSDADCLKLAENLAGAVSTAIKSTNDGSGSISTALGNAVYVIEQRTGGRTIKASIDSVTGKQMCDMANTIGTPIISIGGTGLGDPRGNCGDKAVFAACALMKFAAEWATEVRWCMATNEDHAWNQFVCNGKTYYSDSWKNKAYACKDVAKGICQDPNGSKVVCTPGLQLKKE